MFTNTVVTAPYRGAGRPEASYCLERVVDEAARVTGIDPIRLRKQEPDRARRRSPTRPRSAPPTTPAISPTVLDKGLALADYEGFKARKKEAKKRGLLRGLGVCFVLEHAGGAPHRRGADDVPRRRRRSMLTLNVQSTGQGHATVFPRMVAERLGIKFEQIKHRHGDCRARDRGLRLGRLALGDDRRPLDGENHRGHRSPRARRSLPSALEAGESDIEYKNGAFNVVGTDRRISLFETAAKAAEMKKKGEIAESLDTKLQTETPLTFPNGCHVAEVEIDPQTGQLKLASYTAVDDCGNMLDYTIVEGQTHGAAAMGIGQAIMENTVYDDGGQLLTGSFMDYAMPRAHDLPLFREGFHSCRRPPTRSASRARAKPAPPPRSPR